MADIVKKNDYRNILNIGVYQGASVIALAEATSGKVHCVDLWPVEEWKTTFINALKAKNISNYVIHHMSSDGFFEKHENFRIDFAFIDGDHSVEQVKKDILNSIELGAKDILCHDWKDHLQRKGKRFGVEIAVEELIQEDKIVMIEEIEFMARIKPK